MLHPRPVPNEHWLFPVTDHPVCTVVLFLTERFIISCFMGAFKKVSGSSEHRETIIWRCLPVTSPGEGSRIPKCALINNLSTHKPSVDADAKTN